MTHGSGGGSVQGYNAQVAVTDDHLILGIHLSQDANDTHCFGPTLATAVKPQPPDVTIDRAATPLLHQTPTMPDHRSSHQAKPRPLHTGQPAPTSQAPPREVTAETRCDIAQTSSAQTYKRRSATVETVIAHIKTKPLRRFTRRGSRRHRRLHLAAAVVNLRQCTQPHSAPAERPPAHPHSITVTHSHQVELDQPRNSEFVSSARSSTSSSWSGMPYWPTLGICGLSSRAASTPSTTRRTSRNP